MERISYIDVEMNCTKVGSVVSGENDGDEKDGFLATTSDSWMIKCVEVKDSLLD